MNGVAFACLMIGAVIGFLNGWGFGYDAGAKREQQRWLPVIETLRRRATLRAE